MDDETSTDEPLTNDDVLTEEPSEGLENTSESGETGSTDQAEFDFSLDTTEEPETAYALDWGEEGDGGIPQNYHQGLAEVAKELGYDNVKSARLLARSFQRIQEDEAKETRAIAENLRKEWGEKFNANIRETKKWWNETLKGAKIPPQARAILGSPYGMKLGNYLREKIQGGEGGSYAGGTNSQGAPSAQSQIEAIYSDPKLSRATWDPSDPNYTAVQEKLNKLMGIMND